MLIAKDLHKFYGNIHILKGVSLEVQTGEIVSIVGASGAGKSTLLHLLGTLDKPSEGSIHIDGHDILALRGSGLAAFRNATLGFVFQFHNLLPEFSALENVSIPAYLGGRNRNTAESKAKELLHYLGLGDRMNHRPAQLSGGEQQRIAVARALINSPKIIFADEPTGNLDSANADEMHQLFLRLRQDFNQSFVLVTHNEKLAHLADRKIVMKDGRLIDQTFSPQPSV